MKRRIVMTVAVLLCAVSLFAAVKGSVVLSPMAGVSTGSAAAALPVQTRWMDETKKSPVIDFVLEAESENFRLYADFPVQLDIWERTEGLAGKNFNIPFVDGALDMNFPGIGFMELNVNDSLLLLFGRRQIKWGFGTYSMSIGASQPYLDSVSAVLGTDGKRVDFAYTFTAIGFPEWMQTGQPLVEKTVFAHRFGLSSEHFGIIFSELNLIYDKEPTLYDLTPLALWHDNFQDDYSNVMLDIQTEGKIGSVRVFGSFTMDDLVIGAEANGQPTAMGFSLGAELNLIKGDAKPESLVYTDENLGEGGLNLGAEWYFCSAFMYNRKAAMANGRYTVPKHYLSNTSPTGRFQNDPDGYFLGFPYGPDTMVYRLYANYADSLWQADFALEAIRKGSQTLESIATIYGTSTVPENMGILSLNGPVATVIRTTLEASYKITDSLDAKLSVLWDAGYDFNISAGVQYTI